MNAMKMVDTFASMFVDIARMFAGMFADLRCVREHVRGHREHAREQAIMFANMRCVREHVREPAVC